MSGGRWRDDGGRDHGGQPPRSSGRPLGDGQRNLLCLTGSTQPDADRLADAIRSEGVQDRLHMPDRLAVPVDDDVALVDVRLGSWSSRVDVHHHRARSAALDGHEPEAEAETSARALAILHDWLKATGAEMNEARLRMTRIPKGADLILNKVSGTPGFWIGNVIVMAGVPSIMQAMLDEVAPKLKTGVRMFLETVRADAREGDIGAQLGEIAKANPKVVIGSYPFFDAQRGPNTNVVLRARDPQKLALAKRAVEDMLERVRGAQSSGA